MAGLPKLPGYNFVDPTKHRFHLGHSFDINNGYKVSKFGGTGIGNSPLDTESVAHFTKADPLRYDPSLTYGRTKSRAPIQFLPHYALYDKKCLTFKAFFKQSVAESPLENYRVRHVNIIYFLEDDTITVMEPKVVNSGLLQGRLVRRSKIPKTEAGDYWNWKDLNVGKDLTFYGVVYHTVDCDTFTREYMTSQGLIMEDAEQLPVDPYIQNRNFQQLGNFSKTAPADDKLRRFLEYDGKILKFNAMWDDRDSEHGGFLPYEILYFLSDDTVAVKEVHTKNNGRDPFPQLLRKTKLPKVWTDTPVTFPSIYLEKSDAEVTEYYQPKDFIVGETVFVLGRRMLLYDCDEFTKNYYRKVLCIEQKPAISVEEPKRPIQPKPMPPHDGIGSLEDSLQNTKSFMLKPPRMPVLRQILNANKKLRYEMVFDAVHPEDTIRKFLLMYNLGTGMCSIHEPPIKNSGILGGKYLRENFIKKPGTDPLNPEYYTPADFFIGATITIFQQRFIITGADLHVYRYMEANPEKFPSDVVKNVRNYMFKQGLLKDDIDDQIRDDEETGKKIIRDSIGKDIVRSQTDMEKCIQDVVVSVDQQYEENKRKEVLQQYEDSLLRKPFVPPRGIQEVNKICAQPVHIGEIKNIDCSDLEGNISFAPKHVDTPEETQKKYYDKIIMKHDEICKENTPIPCLESSDIQTESNLKQTEQTVPIMVHPLELPPNACGGKNITSLQQADKCNLDKYDLCNLKTEKTQCDCTNYEKL